MSLGRFLQEFQPMFQALEEPLRSQYQNAPRAVTRNSRGIFDDPFYTQMTTSARPAVDVHEVGDSYRVEAELPGVPRENVNVSISEGGHSLTIEGAISTRKVERYPETEITETSKGKAPETAEGTVAKKESGQVTKQLASERTYVGNTSFTRTVWLPNPVDSNNVSAKLSDGILTVILNKIDDKAVKVNVE